MARKTLLGTDAVKGLEDRLSSPIFTCTSSEQVNHVVYLSASNAVARAIANSDASSVVVGVIVEKPTSTTCRISAQIGPYPASSLTVGAPVYLSASVAGTVTSSKPPRAVQVGIASTTTSFLFGIISQTLAKSDKVLTPLATVANGATTGIVLSQTPSNNSYIQVFVNGVQVNLGDASTSLDCYFSGDGGATARAIEDIVAGNVLYWNGLVAGYDLTVLDQISLHYLSG